MLPPAEPRIYHICHVDNLASISADGFLWPDSEMMRRGGAQIIGNGEIKQDRLRLPVHCHPGTFVGQYVPFYFCPRSVMLYVISRGNHPNVAYRNGQGSVVHLSCRLNEVVAWAEQNQRRWAFTDINAANRAADFFSSLDHLAELRWDAIDARDWRQARDHKMAEFLFHEGFPWRLVRGIGVKTEEVGRRALAAIAGAEHRPEVRVIPGWYY